MQALHIERRGDGDTPNSFRFVWVPNRNRTGRGGLIDVVVPKDRYDLKSREIIAELTAIRYLVIDKMELGDMRGIEKVKLIVTGGQVKKLLQDKSTTYRNLRHYARFAMTCLHPNIKIEVGKGQLQPDNEDLQTINLYEESSVFEETAIGPIEITQHAQERMVERHVQEKQGVPKNPYKTLLSLLSNPQIKRVKLNDSVQSHKRRKYLDDAQKTEIWTSNDTAFNYTVVREENGDGRLVTVFTRTERFDNDKAVQTWADKERLAV